MIPRRFRWYCPRCGITRAPAQLTSALALERGLQHYDLLHRDDDSRTFAEKGKAPE